MLVIYVTHVTFVMYVTYVTFVIDNLHYHTGYTIETTIYGYTTATSNVGM